MGRNEAAVLLNAGLARLTDLADKLRTMFTMFTVFKKEGADVGLDGLEDRVGVLKVNLFSSGNRLKGSPPIHSCWKQHGWNFYG